ncbi:Holliday junction resolvase [Heliophilum fasciatum]|uniref:Holliday junction resolvase hjc n=1 Tax=Heliophilum fasciatum TaxID=35700 RepID=A0A4R2RMM3_9FIRM|nr:Holliday junction resolvase [Heliophilum fasciatum]MCW2279284.1 Holliday junction resolvase [Heliophilum fasciatum]TCP60445.1 Holliday junction resolvase hjc [Heliophilum fasciatum]
MAKRTNYQRGYEIERKIVQELTNRGYLVVRSAGSHSKIDVLGIRKDRIVAVQSKRTKAFSPSAYRKEIAEIQEVIRNYELGDVLEFEFWVWVDRKGFSKWKITQSDVLVLPTNEQTGMGC